MADESRSTSGYASAELVTHAIDLSDAVELARALGRLPGRLDVYAIEGASFTAGDALSPDVERAVDELATALGSRGPG